jgi:hypothetical protein
MTPEESKSLQEHLKAAAAILVKNTPKEQLKDFASIELAVRDHVLKEVAPEIGNFFKQQRTSSRENTKDSDKSRNMAS